MATAIDPETRGGGSRFNFNNRRAFLRTRGAARRGARAGERKEQIRFSR